MNGDFVGGLPEVVVNMSTIQENIRDSYSVIIDTQFYTDMRAGIQVIQTQTITNGDVSGLLIPVQPKPTMTELPHVAVALTPTTYNKFIQLIAHNVSDFSQIYNIDDTSIEILDNLTLLYDRQVYNGTFGSGGELVNYGLLNNPNVVNIDTPVVINSVGDLSAVVEDLKNRVIEATSCSDSEVSFIVSGLDTRKFLKKFSGDNYDTNANIISRAYNQNEFMVLPVNIVSVNKIVAFCNKKVKGHSTGLPTLFNQGRGSGDKYYSFYHFSVGSYGTEMKKKGSVYTQGLTFTAEALATTVDKLSKKDPEMFKAKNKK